MLKARILTALILAPLVICAIFFLPPISFLSVAMLVLLLAGWEWAGLSGLTYWPVRCLYLLMLAVFLTSSLFVSVSIIIALGVVWWLIALILLVSYPHGIASWSHNKWLRSIMGLLVILPCWIGLVILQGFSPLLLIFCLALIWAVDSTAYFVGRKFGRHKLAPLISPGKSYEGALAGLGIALIFGILGIWLLEIPSDQWVWFLIICMIGGGVVTVFGDLFESMIKRQSDTKDSGTILPGHGGLLDRIDSMTTAIPFFALIFPYFFSS